MPPILLILQTFSLHATCRGVSLPELIDALQESDQLVFDDEALPGFCIKLFKSF